ncbi:hypothetical protein [Blastochloris viridis]|uniref:Uncharacterized protein n=1 Tax=Blastochloris viridis TaxID=1079 RepID=A0A0H5BDU3_BLAVI|nr:hypothetical protein [Blastochloris viridis]ALK08229.1 hypothetical protein BVIR_431 [Blastochloris viridis]BAR98506.1 hypothetical protein BV133_913 [Blastochloris viridis]CUU44151.1 hypothetical protein BVIRIDIS_31980 [Blastochloris viridis]
MARFFFTRRGGIEDDQRDRVRRLAELTRAHLALPEAATVSVTELACGDPGCAGGAETVILVMRPGRRTAAAKILKAVAHVEDADLYGALEGLVEAPAGPFGGD